MTTTDPAHPPRPGEGTGPLPRMASSQQSAHTTGPLPPLSEAMPEPALVKALRQQLPAINGGLTSLREGLSQVIYGLVADMLPVSELEPELAKTVLDPVPDVIIRHWLTKVADEQITFEMFLGALGAEGMVTTMKKSVELSAAVVQQRLPGTEDISPMEALNTVTAFQEKADEIKLHFAEVFTTRATAELKGGLDAHVAQELLTLLRAIKG